MTRSHLNTTLTECLLLATVALHPVPSVAQTKPAGPPVIDMHVHTTNTTPQALENLMGVDLRYIFLSGPAPDLRDWAKSYHGAYLPALGFPCQDGHALFVPRQCFDSPAMFPDIDWLRAEVKAGRIRALGELVPEYLGISPQDERLEPYWNLAEEFDLPVNIHMGPGPAGAAYEGGISPVTFPLFRMAFGDPLLLEEVLLRHRRLRIVVAHAGWPRLDSMLALLYAHPNVYVDVGALSAEFMVPRPAYDAYLKSLVEAGFARRIVFGSDFPTQVAPGINAILNAPFLTAEQKADILCNNAAKFLRLPPGTCN